MEQEECDVERECVGLNKKNGRQDKSQCCMKGMDFFLDCQSFDHARNCKQLNALEKLTIKRHTHSK